MSLQVVLSSEALLIFMLASWDVAVEAFCSAFGLGISDFLEVPPTLLVTLDVSLGR